MPNFVALSRSALYSAMVSGQEIYVLEGDELREIRQYGGPCLSARPAAS